MSEAQRYGTTYASRCSSQGRKGATTNPREQIMSGVNWTCPFCGRDTVINYECIHEGSTDMELPNACGRQRLLFRFIVCPNERCLRFTLTASLISLDRDNGNVAVPLKDHAWGLIPPSNAKSFPTFVPRAILEDYREAWSIVELSPKAAATLARRSLQSILRDVWHVSGASLLEDIREAEKRMDEVTCSAVRAVYQHGKIGSHMDHEDINIITDVEPQEPQLLLNLVELLIREWYVTKRERQKRLNQLLSMASGSFPEFTAAQKVSC